MAGFDAAQGRLLPNERGHECTGNEVSNTLLPTVDAWPWILQPSAILKLPFYLFALFLAMVLPLHAQISTGGISSARKISPAFSISTTFSLKLDWNESGGFNGTISRVASATGEALGPITGAGTVQSRLVLIEFPGYGDFRGRMSKDGSVIKGRLLFRENPASQPGVRRSRFTATVDWAQERARDQAALH